jgi:hypothetical protein
MTKYTGAWIVDAGPELLDGYKFRLSASSVDIGPGECHGLSYRVIEVYPSDEYNEYTSIALDAPKGPCHMFGQVISVLFLRRSKDVERLHVCFLNSVADLPYILRSLPTSAACDAHMARQRDDG